MISAILCGGAGARLWPLSREQHPKPFLPLPSTGKSLLQEAYLHAAGLPQTQEILTITNKALYFKAAETYHSTQIKLPTSFILEPFGRNTAPAIGAAALEVANRHGQDTPLLILAADHLIANQTAFAEAVEKALDLAKQGLLVTFGIKPTRPETGYGYIEVDGSRFIRFTEKPDEETAKKYFATDHFYWNAGFFCFQAGTLLRELGRWADPVLQAVKAAWSPGSKANERVLELEPESFAKAPDISIDYAVLEKSDRVAVVPCELGWSDIGSWNEFCGLSPVDDHDNHKIGSEQIILEDTNKCDIHSENRLVATLGVTNLLIVDTPDALLVADKNRTQEVKSIYNRLKAEGQDAYRQHRTVFRPWGSYTLLGEGPCFKIKRLEIKPGAAISLQSHQHRNEHWVIVNGLAEVTQGDKTFLVKTNESTYIKAGNKHRVYNRGPIDLIIIEVQSGDYLSEDDIVRFEDLYGRLTTTNEQPVVPKNLSEAIHA